MTISSLDIPHCAASHSAIGEVIQPQEKYGRQNAGERGIARSDSYQSSVDLGKGKFLRFSWSGQVLVVN